MNVASCDMTPPQTYLDCISQLTITTEDEQVSPLLLQIGSHDAYSADRFLRPTDQLLERRLIAMVCEEPVIVAFETANNMTFDGLVVSIEVDSVCLHVDQSQTAINSGDEVGCLPQRLPRHRQPHRFLGLTRR